MPAPEYRTQGLRDQSSGFCRCFERRLVTERSPWLDLQSSPRLAEGRAASPRSGLVLSTGRPRCRRAHLSQGDPARAVARSRAPTAPRRRLAPVLSPVRAAIHHSLPTQRHCHPRPRAPYPSSSIRTHSSPVAMSSTPIAAATFRAMPWRKKSSSSSPSTPDRSRASSTSSA